MSTYLPLIMQDLLEMSAEDDHDNITLRPYSDKKPSRLSALLVRTSASHRHTAACSRACVCGIVVGVCGGVCVGVGGCGGGLWWCVCVSVCVWAAASCSCASPH